MARYATPSGFDAFIVGGADDGMNANDWGRRVFLPDATPRVIGVGVGIILGIWEFCAFFPAEIVLWQRVSKRGLPSRTSFAPWTTLVLRYLMLCFSVTTAFIEWSTTMPTDAACQTASGFLIASWCALVIVSSFAIAWRAQAVARGIIQGLGTVRLMRLMIATLVLMQVFMAVFTVVWLCVKEHLYTPIAVHGQCSNRAPQLGGRHYRYFIQERRQYYEDPLLWYWVFLIVFNLSCLIIVIVALRTLASRSRGFSKFINGMLNHSLFYFVLVLLLSTMSIIWRKVQNAGWLILPTTVVEAAVMIRILLAEQNAARRPVDTTYMDHHVPSRHFSTRGYPTHADATQAAYPRGDATIQFADQMQGQNRRSGDMTYGASGHLDQAQMAVRPIYQPYSMMDNLGQAFSQVDSRNPHDLDGQSLDLSNRGDSLDVGPNTYPGVEELEERDRREEQTDLELHGSGKQDSGKMLSATNGSDLSGEDGKDQQNVYPPAHGPDGLITQLDVRRASEEVGRTAHQRRARETSVDAESDGDVGIQTVHF